MRTFFVAACLAMLFVVSAACGGETTADVLTHAAQELKADDNPFAGPRSSDYDWTTAAPPSSGIGSGSITGRVFLEIPDDPVDVPNGSVSLRAMPWGDFSVRALVENLAETRNPAAGVTIMRSPGSHLDFYLTLRGGAPTLVLERREGMVRQELESRAVSGAPIIVQLDYRDARVTPRFRSSSAGDYQSFESLYYNRSPQTQGQTGLIAYGSAGDEYVFNDFNVEALTP